MEVKKQQLELYIEQQTAFRLGKEYFKSLYYHSVYLTYMQSTSCQMLDEAQAGIKILGEISITTDMQMIKDAYSLEEKL